MLYAVASFFTTGPIVPSSSISVPLWTSTDISAVRTVLEESADTTHQTNEMIRKAPVSADVSARREPEGMLKADRRRPGRKSLVLLKHGNALSWNVIVVDPVALTHVCDSTERAGLVTENAEKKTK